MLRRAVGLTVIAFCLVSAACGSLVRHNVSMTLKQCDVKREMEPDTRALGALLLSLQDEAWNILYLSGEKKFVRAKKCHHRDSSICAVIEFRINPNGFVRGENAPATHVQSNLMDDFARWKSGLERADMENRCADAVQLEEALRKYGAIE